MKTLRIVILLLIAIAIAIVSPIVRVGAIEDCKEDDYDCVTRKIEEYKKKIVELQGEQKSLKSTITYLDSKTKLAEGEIKKTEIEIALLEVQIVALDKRIQGLEVSLQRLSELLVDRVRETYKQRFQNSFLSLLTAQGFQDFLIRYKYLRQAQRRMSDLIHQAEEQKVQFDAEKQLKEAKQIEIEALKKKLTAQRTQLISQKQQKSGLLEQTKNDEQKYQSLLQAALAEKNALEAAIVNGKQVGPVKKGDTIAIVGNSGYPGCSTGEHLHFEIRKDNKWTDPAEYLSKKTVSDEEKGGESSLGNGSWDWPLADQIRLTQHYGQTPYSWRYKYSGGIHTGYDMVSKSSKIIKAPADGTLYTSSQSCGSSSTINIKYIDHGNGVVSFYLHVQ